MNDEERRIISDFVARIAGAQPAPAAQASPWGGSVPSTQQQRPPLPPVDRDADALIAQLFQQYPEARYRLTQAAFVQEAAIVEMQNRIRQLEWEVENAKHQAQAAQQPRGMFGGMFGGNRPAPAPMTPPPQPQYPPGYNPQMLQPQRGGMGFFGTALAGVAGVAGGMILGNALMNAFSGSHGSSAQAASSPFAPEAGTQAAAASPWTDPGAAAADQGWGGGDKFANSGDKFADQGGGFADSGKFADQGGYGDAGSNQASWGGGGGDGGGDWGGGDEQA